MRRIAKFLRGSRLLLKAVPALRAFQMQVPEARLVRDRLIIRAALTLSRQAEVTYAAELYDDGAGMIDEQGLRERFNLLVAEWTMGDN